jgi:predicted DNA-binding protein (MmcQ/YjbR family)
VAKDIGAAVREACLWLPETEEAVSHGSPIFKVRGKTFAMYLLNHHGDGRVALWLNAPPGAQGLYTREEPKHFFVPPYVGHRGWLGVQLDKGIAWRRVAKLVREAYEHLAPPGLAKSIGKTPTISAPAQKKLSSEQLDPLQSKRAQAVLGQLREICLALPEASEALQFGSPVWRAGKKTFANLYTDRQHLWLAFWVGLAQQGMFTADPRYHVPAYMGHNGWIALDLSRHCNWAEVRAQVLHSYRHFALKRMLKSLGD